MSAKLLNISQQDLQVCALYENEGLPPDDIALALVLPPHVVRASLMTNSPIYRQNYKAGEEDIPEDMFEQLKQVVFDIALDKTLSTHARLRAATYVWDRKRPVKHEADSGIVEFAKALGEGIVAAREKTSRVLAAPDIVVDAVPTNKDKIGELHSASAAEILRRNSA